MLLILILILSLSLVGCGVKGDPVPPATPAEIGTGRPVSKLPYEAGPAALPSDLKRDSLQDLESEEDEEEDDAQ